MDSIKKKTSSIKLGNEMVTLDYTMASIYYLTDKYGDVSKIFSKEETGIDKSYIERIADVVYSGLLNCNDEGEDVSGWTTRKVMNKLKMNQLNDIIEVFTQGMSMALPEGEEDPTQTVPTE